MKTKERLCLVIESWKNTKLYVGRFKRPESIENADIIRVKFLHSDNFVYVNIRIDFEMPKVLNLTEAVAKFQPNNAKFKILYSQNAWVVSGILVKLTLM